MTDRPRRWRRRLVILLVLVVVAGFAVRAWTQRGGHVTPGSWVLVDLGGAYAEDVPDDALTRLFDRDAVSFLELLMTVRDAGEDPRVAGVMVRLRPLAIGWGKANELREALATVRAKGKPVLAYLELELSGGALEYFVASAAERIYVPPGAAAPVTGLLAQFVFLGGVWEKLDVDMQVLKIREYKTAGDMLSEKTMTVPHREMADALLDSLYAQLVDAVASGRGLTPEAVRAAIDAGPATPAELEAAGLVDETRFLDELRGELLGARGAWLTRADYAAARRPLPDTPPVSGQVAVIYGAGTVTTGESETGPTGEGTMGADTLVEAFREAALDESIDAIVFRVDSPGGSALGADLIWRAAESARGLKPVIVSMSDVAASGGYYVAAPGSRIFADPGTITGSIGVVLAKPNVRGLLAKLGINTVELERGELASMLSVNESFSPAELTRLTATMDYVYELFLERVAAGRPLDAAAVNAVGRGRVWTGAQAQANGLVDELGGFFTAINAAKDAAGLSVDDKVGLVFYPRHKSLVERLGRAFGTRLFGAAPAWWQQLQRATAAWRFPAGSVLTLMPQEVSIR